jgi:U4/U6 small nuclear ribonucleoprotein PRP4
MVSNTLNNIYVMQNEQEKLIHIFEVIRMIDRILVPMDLKHVDLILRKIGAPISLFGERESDKRDRLKNQLIKLKNEQFNDMIDGYDLLEKIIESFQVNQKETFYTDSCVDVKNARIWLADFSIRRAKKRLVKQNKLISELRFKDDKKRRESIFSGCRTYTNNLSKVADSRPVNCCAFNHDGSNIVTAGWSGFVKIWSVPRCDMLISIKAHDERITGLASNPNPAYSTDKSPAIATGSADNTIRLWTSDGKLLDELHGHEDRINKIAFHPSGRFLATACFDHTWRLWDLSRITTVSTGGYTHVRYHNMLYEQEGHCSPVYSLAFQHDGSLLGSGGFDAIGRIWDLRTGRNIVTLEGHAEHILAIDFSADGYHLITGSQDNSCRVWDLRKATCDYCIAAHKKLVTDVKYRPGSGDYFLTAGFDNEARVWSSIDGSLVRTLTGHENKIMGLDVHPDPALELAATVSYDRTLRIWSLS